MITAIQVRLEMVDVRSVQHPDHFRTGSEVDAIMVKYGDKWGANHGGGGGDVHNFEISPSAKIVIVQGRYGSR